ncbi:MAG: thiamine phosphate synthase [Candidatus Dadabacteria bacterium]|nr:thiamine phosphate synthase [Candidatus Dadabacteria bacterium]NIQ14086.1 thiamine phosphate synthase [Candidatus Dadabacteria bacterium]
MKFNLSGLYVITAKHLMPGDSLLNKVESSLKGGARVVQLRDKDSSKSEIIDQGKKLLELTKKYRVPLIINDSPEIAREIGADGVHIGMGDSDISFVREILGNDSIIGVSCYDDLNRGQMAEKMGADYVAFGTPYDTPTKPGRKKTHIFRDTYQGIAVNKNPGFCHWWYISS